MDQRSLPLVLLLSGGYAATPKETADLHAVIFREAAAVASGAGPPAGSM